LKIGCRHFGYETDPLNRDFFELLNLNQKYFWLKQR